jgi:two-component sensor histidine kinase
VKNTLATVQSMAVNTLKTSASVEDGRKAIEARLMGMARAHDLLTEAHWTSADLATLLNCIVDPYRTYQSRIRLYGPDLRLNPRAALTMAMVINELTTNAVKYGSLSHSEGRLTLSWARVADDGRSPNLRPPSLRTLRLTWREAGAPAVAEPSRRGFGSVLIEQSLRELRGTVTMAYEPGGLVCTFDIPLDALEHRAPVTESPAAGGGRWRVMLRRAG